MPYIKKEKKTELQTTELQTSKPIPAGTPRGLGLKIGGHVVH